MSAEHSCSLLADAVSSSHSLQTIGLMKLSEYSNCFHLSYLVRQHNNSLRLPLISNRHLKHLSNLRRISKCLRLSHSLHQRSLSLHSLYLRHINLTSLIHRALQPILLCSNRVNSNNSLVQLLCSPCYSHNSSSKHLSSLRSITSRLSRQSIQDGLRIPLGTTQCNNC